MQFGRQIYGEHYSQLESIMGREGREWLDWDVRDDWLPLCEFLGRQVPKAIQFPSGNDQKEFVECRARIHGERHRRMRRNMWITGGVVCIGFATAVAWVMT